MLLGERCRIAGCVARPEYRFDDVARLENGPFGPLAAKHVENLGETRSLLLVLLGFEEHVPEIDRLRSCRRTGRGVDMPLFLVGSECRVLRGGEFDGGTDHVPPGLEPGGRCGSPVLPLTASRIAEEDRVE